MKIMQESQNLRRVIFKHFIFSKEMWPINVRLTVNFHQESKEKIVNYRGKETPL